MDIVIERGKVVKLEDLPVFSIALDGFVSGPQIDNTNHRYSFDHHANCLRYCTTSACMQSWTAIQLGLEPDKYTIYVNDVDLDVCASIWCFQNHDKCDEALVIKLINAINQLDMHGAAFPVHNGIGKIVEWVAAPETDSKRNQDYYKLSNEGLRAIMESVLHRIDLYVSGEASIEVSKQQKHGEFKILRNENGWALISTQDPHAFSAIYQAGFDRIVLVRSQDDGSNAITLAKRSDFIDGFPLFKLYEEFNKIEPGWG